MKNLDTTTIQLWNTNYTVNTTSWLLSAFLGISGKDTELINEVPKELRWDKQYKISNDDIFVFSQQKRRLDSLQGKVDFAITTLPLLIFALNNKKDPDFSRFVRSTNKKYPSINILLKSDTQKYKNVKNYLEENNEEYEEFENHPFVSLDILIYLERKGLLKVNKDVKRLRNLIGKLKREGKIDINRLLINHRKRKNKTKTVNFSFYAPPSGGKSTTARIFAALLKLNNQKTELVDEVPKEMVWNEEFDRLSDQMFVFSQQNRKLENLQGLYDFTVNDSPLDIQHMFARLNKMPKEFHSLIDHYHNKYHTVDIFLNRKHKYQQVGRVQTEEESKNIGKEIKDFLDNKEVPLHEFETTPLVAFQMIKHFDKKYYDISKDMEILINEIEKTILPKEKYENNIEI